MIPRHNLRPLVKVLVSVLTLTYALTGQSSTNSLPFTIEDVVKLCKAGLTDELVITKIKKNNKAFDLSPDELIELRKSGVSDAVIKYLLDPAQPYAPPPPAPAPATAPPAAPPTGAPPLPLVPAPPVKQYPPDPDAANIPGEPGVYYIAGNA